MATVRKRKKGIGSDIRIKGFVRFALKDVFTGEERISPWYENALTITGFQNGVVGCIGGVAASSQVTGIAVGHMTNANSGNGTYLSTLSQFDSSRRGIAAATPGFSTYGTLSASASWESNLATGTINAFGMVGYTTGTPPLYSIATVASSDKATNQTLSVTYQWRFASA